MCTCVYTMIHVSIFSCLSYTVPSPSPPVISLVSNYLLYAGVETVLNCTTVFTDSIHNMKDINVTWQRGNDTIYIDNVVASMREDTSLHVSLLTIPSTSLSDSGNITCIVTVYDDILSSIGVPSKEFTLEIESMKHMHVYLHKCICVLLHV